MENPIEASLSILPHEKLIEILLALDSLEDINNACRSSTIFARVCRDDYFWKLRYRQDFGSGCPSKEMLKGEMPLKPYITSSDSMPWREFYQSTIEMLHFPPLSVGISNIGVIDQNGQLNMWGPNLFGELGNGTKVSTNVPQIVLSNVSQVSCGYKMTVAVTKDGKVYAWGSNNNQGILGIGSYQTYVVLVPTLVKLPKKVRKIDNDIYSSIALTENGEIYVWGKLLLSQVPDDLYTGVPVKLNLPLKEKVIDVAVGLNAFAAITKSGKLYMWGNNMNYLYLSENWKNKAAGIYNPDDPEHRKFIQPILIPFSEHIIQISMSARHFGIVTRRGELWMTGDNYYRQIGEYTSDQEELNTYVKLLEKYKNNVGREDDTNIPTLIPIKLPSPVLYFNSRWATSLVKLKDGRVLIWGDNNKGQIDSYCPGRQTRVTDGISIGSTVSKPVEIRLDHQILCIMAGYVFTAAITDDDYVNLWGKYPIPSKW